MQIKTIMKKKLISFHSYRNRRMISGVILIVILLFYTVINNNCNNPAKDKNSLKSINYTNDYGFSFDIPEFCEVFSTEEIERIRGIDPSITFMALTGLPFVCSTVSISVYDLHQETLLDSAFIITVKHIPTPPDDDPAWNYRLIDYGTQLVDTITLRYKISCVDSTDYHIMYYFMRNNKSNILFEMKAICYSQNEINSARDFLEGIALTVKFISE